VSYPSSGFPRRTARAKTKSSICLLTLRSRRTSKVVGGHQANRLARILEVGLIVWPSSGSIVRAPRQEIEAIAFAHRRTGLNVRTQRGHRHNGASDQSRPRNSKNEPQHPLPLDGPTAI
jgi:hypothetical protein